MSETLGEPPYNQQRAAQEAEGTTVMPPEALLTRLVDEHFPGNITSGPEFDRAATEIYKLYCDEHPKLTDTERSVLKQTVITVLESRIRSHEIWDSNEKQ